MLVSYTWCVIGAMYKYHRINNRTTETPYVRMHDDYSGLIWTFSLFLAPPYVLNWLLYTELWKKKTFVLVPQKEKEKENVINATTPKEILYHSLNNRTTDAPLTHDRPLPLLWLHKVSSPHANNPFFFPRGRGWKWSIPCFNAFQGFAIDVRGRRSSAQSAILIRTPDVHTFFLSRGTRPWCILFRCVYCCNVCDGRELWAWPVKANTV